MKIDIDNHYELGDLVLVKDPNASDDSKNWRLYKSGRISAVIVESTLRPTTDSESDDAIDVAVRYKVDISLIDVVIRRVKYLLGPFKTIEVDESMIVGVRKGD